MSHICQSLNRISAVLEAVNESFGKALSWLVLGMVVVTFLVVLLRYFFNIGSIAMQESVSYMHAMVFMLGAAYTLKHQGHVRVDIFYRHFSAQKRAVIDLLGNVLFLIPVSLFIFYISLNYVEAAWRIKETSLETGGLPFAYLLKTVIPVMAVLLILQAIASSLSNVAVLLQKNNTSDNEASI